MTRARGILSLILALCALMLTGCAGFPTSGPVEYGRETGDTGDGGENLVFIPNRPQPGATPQQIVEGFIDAGSGPGAGGTWAVAREFLAAPLQDTWNPEASVIVDERAERDYVETEGGGVSFAFDVVATVDEKGVYEGADGSPGSQGFRLEQQADGEWRIAEAPDGIWLDEAQFPTVFHRYPLMYFDPTWEYLVPDVRWFPVTTHVSSITVALVNMPPSAWLEGAVATAFPEDVTATPAVVVDESGVAAVALSAEALAARSDVLDRMLTQLEESLRPAGVTDVVMTVDSTPVDAEPVAVRSTRVAAAPLVMTEGGFGFLSGDSLEKIPGLSEAVENTNPVSVQVAPERDFAAAKLSSGEGVRLAASGVDPEILDTRAGLVAPAIDGFGTVWSVPRDEPGALRAFVAGGEVRDVADAWPDASAISAMALSRDGTRIAAAVTSGGRTALWVAGVVRDPGGQEPLRLGTPVPLAALSDPAIGVTWIDETTIGALVGGDEESTVVEQVVGAPASSSAAPAGMTSIVGGSSASSLRLLGADGSLYVKRGTTWQPTSSGVLLLASQQGVPQ